MMAWMVVVLSVRTGEPVRLEPQTYPTAEDCHQDIVAIEDVDPENEYATCRLVQVPRKQG